MVRPRPSDLNRKASAKAGAVHSREAINNSQKLRPRLKGMNFLLKPSASINGHPIANNFNTPVFII